MFLSPAVISCLICLFVCLHKEETQTKIQIKHCCCCVASVVSNSVGPHRRQPTRLPRSWDSPDKDTGVGCHFLLQFMKVKSEREVAQSCPTLSDPMDCSPPGSSIHGFSRQEYWCGVPLPSLDSMAKEVVKIVFFCY